MATDPTAVKELARLIGDLSRALEDGETPKKDARDTLVDAAERLAIAARDPEDNMYSIAGQIASSAAIRSVISMGILDEIPTDESSISVEEVASRKGMDSELVGRILRACASAHFLASPGVGLYTHNALSRTYLSPDNRALSAQVYDFTGPGVLAIPEFCESNGWKSAGDYFRGPFQLAVQTDLGYWEYWKTYPDRMKSFNTGMRIGKIGRRISAFPFGRALELNPCGEGGIAIVDVGGGRGQSLEAIREDWPQIEGRWILQDLPDVVADAVQNGLPSWIEPQPGTFFDKQVAKGARIYYFRRIFHCWTNERSQQILQNTKEAMDDYSRILIADMVLPDTGCPRDLAMQDLNMMSLGGMERSESAWRNLLEKVGLVMRKVWMNEDGPKHAIIEAVLPQFKGSDI